MTAKEMAQTMVADGQSPNMYFVTIAPWYLPKESECAELIPGFNTNDIETIVFYNKKEAMRYYSMIDLHFESGIGQVMVEDRMVGVLCERFLKEVTAYVEEEGVLPVMPF